MTTCIGTYTPESGPALFADTRIICTKTQNLGYADKIIEIIPGKCAVAVAGSAAMITAIRAYVADVNDDNDRYFTVPKDANDAYSIAQDMVESIGDYGIVVPETVPARDMHCQLLVASTHGLWLITNDRAVMTLGSAFNENSTGYSNFMVIGSGRKYATGAMHLCADPVISMGVASQYDYATGVDITVWRGQNPV